MTIRTRYIAAFGQVAVAAGLLLLCAPAALAGTISPLPASDYGVRAACSAPAPDHAGCLVLQLVPETAEARAHTHPLGMARQAAAPSSSPVLAGDIGLRPEDLHTAYALPSTAPGAQTVALVDAYNDPSAQADLTAYDEEFGLPECTNLHGCFTQVNELGKASPLPFPKTTSDLEAARAGTKFERERAAEASGWDLEISLDIETVHATCQSCKIILVESESPAYSSLETAERTAALLGAGTISNSWGGPEEEETAELEQASAFNDPGVVITDSAGDDGYLSWDAANSAERGFAEFPASSPHVVAVGGTRLELEAGGKWAGESVWNGDGAGGGGCSTVFEAPLWQQNVAGFSKVGCRRMRAVSDIAADADPYSGVAIRDSSPNCKSEYKEHGEYHTLAGWCTVGGTSLSSPLVASAFALAGGAKGAPYPARTLYQNELATPASLHDVTVGSNGRCAMPFLMESGLSGCPFAEEAKQSCSSKRICLAGSGYDGPSGLGTPDGIADFIRSSEDEAAAEEAPPPEREEEQAQEEPPEETRQQTPPAGNGTGAESGATPPPGASTPAAIGTYAMPATAPAPAKVPIALSSLSLTRAALIALNNGRPKISAVGFRFSLSAAAVVRASLARRVHSHGHSWSLLHRALSFNAARGLDSHRLGGSTPLVSGFYRLTLTAPGGSTQSVVFQIG